ncbi:MAG: class I SAM-dependent methyltransferase [Aerococcus sp.]|nr:class I SAM-dependent methyltransferase [Aerococcus sp.]
MPNNIIAVTHHYLKEWLRPGQIAVDATVGQGFDTQQLAEYVGKTGHVYGFDIQATAIKATTERLAAAHLNERVTLYHAGHEQLDALLPKEVTIDLAIFNLGYLPHGDKTIITHPETTLAAIRQILNRLNVNGHLLIAAYIGHPGGHEEYEAITEYLTALDQRQFTVGRFEFINQKNYPPKLLTIERRPQRES